MHTNVKAEIPLVGDAKVLLPQITSAVKEEILPDSSSWWKALRDKTAKNKIVSDKLNADRTIPMNYYSAIKLVEDAIHS